MFLLHFGPDVKVPSRQTLCKHVRHYFEQKYMSLYRFDIETECMLPDTQADTPPCDAISLGFGARYAVDGPTKLDVIVVNKRNFVFLSISASPGCLG
jgi:hypothetical protein